MEPIFLLAESIKLHQILSYFSRGLPDLAFCPAPFQGSQFIQLRPPCIRRSIFLDHVKTGGQNVQIAAIPVFNLDVILYHLLDLYLFNPPVNAKTVVFMDHIIPDLQLIEVVDLSSFICLFFLLFLFFRSENITFGNHHKL